MSYTSAVDAKTERIEQALRAVLPAGTAVVAEPTNTDMVYLEIGETSVGAQTAWIGEGWLSDVRRAIMRLPNGLDFVTAHRLSPGARAAATEAGLGWIDESGAAELSLPGVIVSRSGSPEPKRDPSFHWTRSMVGTAEALLVGARPTVAGVAQTTGLSAGAATNALASLTALGLLQTAAARGRNSARQIVDRTRLLNEYANAAVAIPKGPSLRVGIVGDLISELSLMGKRWDSDAIPWAATGAAAASVMAPYLSQVTTVDVFIDVKTLASLVALAQRFRLHPTDSGRLLLRPFPTSATQRLASKVGDLHVAPWPRVYADLRVSGVRGEEAAEHLREVTAGV